MFYMWSCLHVCIVHGFTQTPQHTTHSSGQETEWMAPTSCCLGADWQPSRCGAGRSGRREAACHGAVTYDANTLVSHWAWCSFSSVFVDFDCYSTTTTAVLPIRTNAASAVWSQEGSAIKMRWWVSPSWPNTEGRLHPVTSSQHFWLSAPWHNDHDAQLQTFLIELWILSKIIVSAVEHC